MSEKKGKSRETRVDIEKSSRESRGGGPPQDFPNDPDKSLREAAKSRQYTKQQDRRMERANEAGVRIKDFAYEEGDPKREPFKSKWVATPAPREFFREDWELSTLCSKRLSSWAMVWTTQCRESVFFETSCAEI